MRWRRAGAYVAGAALLPLAAAPEAAARERAALVLLHGHVLTMDEAQPEAQAVAVRNGRIIAVGSDAEVLRLTDTNTRRIDLRGHTLVPGFIDSHMHPRPSIPEMSRWGTLDMSPAAGVTSRAAFLAKIAAKARRLPPGGFVVGIGYDDSALGGHPDIAVLDQAAAGHPLAIFHVSGHRMLANTPAFARAGISAATPDPAGGVFGRRADGTRNGQVLEKAMATFQALVSWPPAPEKLPQSVVMAGYRREFRQFLAYGLTGVADAAATPASLAHYRMLLRDRLPVSIYAMTTAEHLDWLVAHRRDPDWQVPGLTMRTIKIFAGNSLSGHTALLAQPYADSPGEYPSGYRGLEPALQPPELLALLRRVKAAGLQAAVHANGDVEIERVLGAFAQLRAESDSPASFAATRHRIEHASITTPAIIAQIKANDICLAPHSYILNLGARLEAFGAARFDGIEPNRLALDAGICIGGNSDHPVSPPRVMQRIQSLVTRRALSNGKVYGAARRLSVREALRVYTLGSAYLQFEERVRGSLIPGKRADMVELAADPERVKPGKIGDIAVLRTIIGGKTVYRRIGARTTYGW